MQNKAMERKLDAGEAVDISQCPIVERPEIPGTGRYYDITDVFVAGAVDYCDGQRERWVWSIGQVNGEQTVLASLSGDLYQNPQVECLWLR